MRVLTGYRLSEGSSDIVMSLVSNIDTFLVSNRGEIQNTS